VLKEIIYGVLKITFYMHRVFLDRNKIFSILLYGLRQYFQTMFWQDNSALQAELRSSATVILNGDLYQVFQEKNIVNG
jgi:hypothetical protein